MDDIDPIFFIYNLLFHCFNFLKRGYVWFEKNLIKYALKAGESLIRIKKFYSIEKKNFSDFLKECNINFNKSFI